MELKSFYKIRFSDCDSFKHLHNSNYIDMMLNAREDHLKDFHQITMTDLYAKGSAWMVGSHEINYLRPAFYGENVCIHSALIKASEDSLLVEMLMKDEKESHIKAILWTRFIHVNIQNNKREKHPEWFMDIARSIEDKNFPTVNLLKERLAILR
jgi:YbgC/YbaW family acyl-CoA thioester hydrolase